MKYVLLNNNSGKLADNILFSYRTSNALFTFHWQADGSVAFQANNGKYIATKKSGHLFANADSPDDESARFYFYLINR